MIGESFFFFFFNDTATTEIYTLSLHDALPIWEDAIPVPTIRSRGMRITATGLSPPPGSRVRARESGRGEDRKSTRLNSSHANISYAVFCLKKKKKNKAFA